MRAGQRIQFERIHQKGPAVGGFINDLGGGFARAVAGLGFNPD